MSDKPKWRQVTLLDALAFAKERTPQAYRPANSGFSESVRFTDGTVLAIDSFDGGQNIEYYVLDSGRLDDEVARHLFGEAKDLLEKKRP
jgi:hypothetical protein